MVSILLPIRGKRNSHAIVARNVTNCRCANTSVLFALPFPRTFANISITTAGLSCSFAIASCHLTLLHRPDAEVHTVAPQSRSGVQLETRLRAQSLCLRERTSCQVSSFVALLVRRCDFYRCDPSFAMFCCIFFLKIFLPLFLRAIFPYGRTWSAAW